MIIRDILSLKGNTIFSIAPDGLVADAVATLVKNDIGSLVVMADGTMQGMLTFREVLRALDTCHGSLGDLAVREVMVREPLAHALAGDRDRGCADGVDERGDGQRAADDGVGALGAEAGDGVASVERGARERRGDPAQPVGGKDVAVQAGDRVVALALVDLGEVAHRAAGADEVLAGANARQAGAPELAAHVVLEAADLAGARRACPGALGSGGAAPCGMRRPAPGGRSSPSRRAVGLCRSAGRRRYAGPAASSHGGPRVA